MKPNRTVIALALSLAVVACASLSVKQKVFNTHQSIRTALVALDDFERQICLPNPIAVNTCTAQPVVISDADHQKVSRLLADAFAADVKIGQAIVAWQPGTPAPKDLISLAAYVQQVKEIVTALAPSPRTDQFFALIQAVLDAINETQAAFGGV